MSDLPWDNVNAVEMLPMPKARTLKQVQIEGKACVWCSDGLDGDSTLHLGPRIRVAEGTVKRWWPRACWPCVGAAARRVLGLHRRTCARCSHRDYCPDSRALDALARECG